MNVHSLTDVTAFQALLRKRVLLQIGGIGLVILAAISVFQGVHNAELHSQDFQWNPTVVLLQGDDPYQLYMDNSESSRLAGIVPFYSHSTYLLLFPLSLLSFESAKIFWAALNVCFAASIFLLLPRRFDTRTLSIVSLVFLCSTPVRNAIGNGQQSLLCLFMYIVAIWIADKRNNALSSLVAGIASFKYSFGVPLIFSFWDNKWRNLVAYLAPTVLGVLFWALYFHKDLIEAGLLPLRVALAMSPTGTSDFLSLLISAGVPHITAMAISLFVLIMATTFQALLLPIKDPFDRFSFYGLLSLLLFYHQSYDQVFLLGCLLTAARSQLPGVKLAVFSIVGYFWFGLKAISLIGVEAPIEVNHILLLVLTGTLLYELRSVNLYKSAAAQNHGLMPAILPDGGLIAPLAPGIPSEGRSQTVTTARAGRNLHG